MTFVGLLNAITQFIIRALCGLLLVALVPFLLVGLGFHWFDVGGADWAAKWIVTVFSPFFVAFVFIFWKVWHLARTGRHIGMWATFLVWGGTVGVEAFLLHFGAYNLR
jgi:hypothetical protein